MLTTHTHVKDAGFEDWRAERIIISSPVYGPKRGFQTLGDLAVFWKQRGGREGFINLKEISVSTINEIEKTLRLANLI